MEQYKFPCLKCQDRKPGCHSQCEKYLKAKAINDEKNEHRKKIKTAEVDAYNYAKARGIAIQRRRGGKPT